MPKHAKISGYNPEAVAKILKAFDSHLWRAAGEKSRNWSTTKVR